MTRRAFWLRALDYQWRTNRPTLLLFGVGWSLIAVGNVWERNWYSLFLVGLLVISGAALLAADFVIAQLADENRWLWQHRDGGGEGA